MRDDDFIQVVLVVSGDTEEVQFVALLIISDLETTWGSSLRSSSKKAATALRFIQNIQHMNSKQSSVPGDTAQPLNHLFIPAHTWPEVGGLGGIKRYYNSDWEAPSTCSVPAHGEQHASNHTLTHELSFQQMMK